MTRTTLAPLSRSTRLLALGGIVATTLTVAACAGGGAAPAGTAASVVDTAPFSVEEFVPSEGTDIETVEIDYANQPFGDAMLALIGQKSGYFDEVGIELPQGEAIRSVDETRSQMLNGQLDFYPATVGQLIQTYEASPQLKSVMFNSNFLGNYILASPTADVEPFVAGGDFEETIKENLQQLKGKRVALSDNGANREFFNTMLELGGLSPEDFTLEVIDDTKIVELGKSGAIDFALPAGAAQNLELMNVGFFRMAGIGDLIDGLPAGDPRVLNGLDYTSVVGDEAWIVDNLEAVLRLNSVFYRIADDVASDPDTAIATILPALQSSAGVNLDLAGAVGLYTQFYSLISFEEAGERFTDASAPLYFETVYEPQIAAAIDGGVVQESTGLTPESVVWGRALWEIADNLRTEYETIASTGIQGELADQAAVFYEHRNYLDAYRYAAAAAAQG